MTTAATPIRGSEIELRSVDMRILIIDDSVVMRKIVESALRHAGLEQAQVLHACDGLDGLALLETAAERNESFDLILCDVHMPVMDGLGFLIEKPRRNLAPGVPVVMITADASDPHLLQAIAAGAQGYISKPFTLEQMQARVASLLLSPV
jgi:two-component system, chemotaxis family, chemotaxis protein CheY